MRNTDILPSSRFKHLFVVARFDSGVTLVSAWREYEDARNEADRLNKLKDIRIEQLKQKGWYGEEDSDWRYRVMLTHHGERQVVRAASRKSVWNPFQKTSPRFKHLFVVGCFDNGIALVSAWWRFEEAQDEANRLNDLKGWHEPDADGWHGWHYRVMLTRLKGHAS